MMSDETNKTIKDSGNRTEFKTGAVRDMHEGKGRYDLIPYEAMRRLAVHCEKGAKKYGERNCEKGIPVSSLVDSAMRHLQKYNAGHQDEDHLTAALWNISFIMYMEDNFKGNADILNLPWMKEGEDSESLQKRIDGLEKFFLRIGYKREVIEEIENANGAVTIKDKIDNLEVQLSYEGEQ